MQPIHQFEGLLPAWLEDFLGSLYFAPDDSPISSPSFTPYYAELECIYRSFPPTVWAEVARVRQFHETELTYASDQRENLEMRLTLAKGWKKRWARRPGWKRRLRAEKEAVDADFERWNEGLKRAERGAFALLALREDFLEAHLSTGATDLDNPTQQEVDYVLKDLLPLSLSLSASDKRHLGRRGVNLDRPPSYPTRSPSLASLSSSFSSSSTRLSMPVSQLSRLFPQLAREVALEKERAASVEEEERKKKVKEVEKRQREEKEQVEAERREETEKPESELRSILITSLSYSPTLSTASSLSWTTN
ncbi:hypothetical protein JCM6882_007831 [Rhodosporidiobolus microsporus]